MQSIVNSFSPDTQTCFATIQPETINNPNRITDIFKLLIPISLSSSDLEGNTYQLWKRKATLVLTIVNKWGGLRIIPGNRVYNALQPQENGKDLLEKLEKQGPKKWQIAFMVERATAYIWPYLKAAVRDEPLDPSQTLSGIGEISISDKTIYQDGKHFNKHGRLMGFNSKKEYDQAARDFAKKYQSNPNARIIEGNLNTGGKKNERPIQRAITYEGKTIVIDPKTGQIRDFYPAGNNSALVDQVVIREGNLNEIPEEKPQRSICLIREGALTGPGDRQFQQTIQKTRLCASYNQTHARNPIPPKGSTGAEIGGVGCHIEMLKGLFESPESLFENEHHFYIPHLEDGLPFSDSELRQLVRELAIGIYVHDTIPFFSLHFNQNGDLYPVIHPVYEHTLVGQVISMLDYIMKGYLNGGVFNEPFVQDWHENPNWFQRFNDALREVINFKDYSSEHLKGEDQHYVSLRDLTFNISHSDQDEPSIFKDLTQFTNSFRIIAKQKSIQKADNLFVLDWDFDVKYTIEPNPDYLNALQQYGQIYGKMPQPYEKMVKSYELMSHLVHDHMIKLPLCRKYFSMLGLINFLSSYFMTLKKHSKIPLLPTFYLERSYRSPPLFPHLPIGQFRQERVKLNLDKILDSVLKEHLKAFESYLTSDNPERDGVALKKPLEDSMLNILLRECSPALGRTIKKSGLNKMRPSIQNHVLEILTYLHSSFKEFCEIYPNDSRKLFIKSIPVLFQKNSINLSLEDYVIKLQSELNTQEKESGKKIVGGCGLEIIPQVVLSSAQGEAILQNDWANIQQSEPETWVKVRMDDEARDSGAVFHLAFEDIPSWGVDHYQWMEFALLASSKEDEKLLNDMEQIIATLMAKDIAGYQKLLDHTPDLAKMRDRYDRSLLHVAALDENPFYAKELLSKGLSITQVDAQGYMPLHYAAMNGHLKQMEQLIVQAPQTVYATSLNRATPLIIAIQNGHTAAVKLLLEKGAKGNVRLATGYTALHCALHQGKEEVVIELLGSSKEAYDTLNECTEEGVSPLMLACELKSEKLVTYFLEHKADPKVKRRDGYTALDIAIELQSLPICKLLVHVSSLSNHTVELAIKESSAEIFELLVRKPNFLKYRNFGRETPLLIAIRHGNTNAALRILRAIIDIEDLVAINSLGKSAFDLSIQGKFFTLLEALLNKEINNQKAIEIEPMDLLRQLCNAGYSPFLKKYLNEQTHLTAQDYQELLQVAAEAGQHLVITLLLLPKKVDLDSVQGVNGWKLEHYLAKSDGVFLFKKIARGKQLFNSDSKIGNKTLAYLAAESGSWLVLRFLLEQMKIHNISLENHFNERHLFYGIIERGEQEGVKLILKIIPDLSLMNAVIAEGGIRPVHLAAKMGSKTLLELLHLNGSKLDMEDGEGYTPLYYAVRCQSLDAVSFLLEQQVLVTSDALYAAASGEDKEFLDVLLKYTADINVACTKNRDTALLKAIKASNYQAFLLLIASHASLECQNQDGWTPLLLASGMGQSDMLEVIASRVPFNESFIQGNNALHMACKGKHAACVKILLRAGYNQAQLNHEHLSPRQLAEGHKGILAAFGENQQETYALLLHVEEALLAGDLGKIKQIIAEFPINEKVSVSKNGHTLTGTILHLALSYWNNLEHIAEIATMLSTVENTDLDLCNSEGDSYAHLFVKAGFSPVTIPHLKLDRTNHKGQTTLHLAASECDEHCLETLITTLDPALVNRADEDGLTPLFYAIKAKKQRNVEILLKKGADSSHRTISLVTPLILACALEQQLIARTLVENGADINQPGTIQMVTPLYISLSLLKNDDLSLYLLFQGASSRSIGANGDQLSHIAARTGKVSILRFIASQGGSLEVSNHAGLQPIHLASKFGKVKVLSLFHSLNMFIDAPVFPQNNEKNLFAEDKVANWMENATPLLIAAASGQVDTARWLLKHHANTELTTKEKLGVLACSAISMNKTMLEVFREYSLLNNEQQVFPAIIQAIRNDDPLYLSALYCHCSFQTEFMKGWTGLHFASHFGALQATQFFINKGVNPTLSSNSEESALDIAAANRSVEQFRLLLNSCGTSLDLNRFNERKETLLHIATRAGNILHVMLLIDYGASLDEPDALGRTALHVAAQEGYEDIALLLVACGADLNLRTIFSERTPLELVKEEDVKVKRAIESYRELKQNAREGETLLHLAVKACNNKGVLLLSRCENVNQKDCTGRTPLHVAVQLQNFSLIRILLKSKAEINSQDLQGRTPLWIACIEKKNIALAKFLIKAGADPKIVNVHGMTIKNQLLTMNFPEIQELLRVLG